MASDALSPDQSASQRLADSFMGFAAAPAGLCEHVKGAAACRVEAQGRWPLSRRMCAAHAVRFLDPEFRGCGCGPGPCGDCGAYIAAGQSVVVSGERENGPEQHPLTSDARMLAALREDNQVNREGRALPLFQRHRRAFSWGSSRRRLESFGARWSVAMNLLGSSPKVGEWDAGLAREVAHALLPHLRGYRVLLAGFRVGEAFGFDPWEGPATLSAGLSFVSGPKALEPPPQAACAPHPSGRNRSWNDPASMGRARDLFRALLMAERADG